MQFYYTRVTRQLIYRRYIFTIPLWRYEPGQHSDYSFIIYVLVPSRTIDPNPF